MTARIKRYIKTAITIPALFLAFGVHELQAQPDTQLALTASVSNLNPKSNEEFELNIILSSQGLGNSSVVNGAVIRFNLPPHLDIVATPTLGSNSFTVATTGDTQVTLTINDPFPVGIVRSFKFLLKYEAGVSVHDVDATAIYITADSDNSLQGTTTTATINPANNAKPTIMEVTTTGAADNLHCTSIKLQPEALTGGLNHNNARVRIAIDKYAVVNSIRIDGAVAAVSPTIVGDSAIYILPLGVFEAGARGTEIRIYYACPLNAACPAPNITYDLNIAYLADREAGATDTPVAEYAQQQEVTVCQGVGCDTDLPYNVAKTAPVEALRAGNTPQYYYITFSPVQNARNIVIIDDPTGNEADFFTVNRFTQVSWKADTSELYPEVSAMVKTKVYYEYSDALNTWNAVNSTPAYNGSSSAFSTVNSRYVTRIKLEFFADDGISTEIPAYAGKVKVTVAATMTSDASNSVYIPDNELNNTIFASGDLYRNNAYRSITQNGVANRIQSKTILKEAAVHSYWAYPGFWYSRPDVESSGDPRVEIPFNVWGIFNGYQVYGLVHIGDEVWFKGRFDVEEIEMKDPVLMFHVSSSDFEALDVAGGHGAGDFTYEIFPVPSGGTVVKVTLNGQHRRGNVFSPSPNNPFEPDGWVHTGEYYGDTDIGIKLRVKPGAASTSVTCYIGTTNFSQPLTGGWGGGGDFYSGGVGANEKAAYVSSGAMSGSTGVYWAFQGTGGTLTVDNALGLKTQKSASFDGVDFAQGIMFNNVTTDSTVYFKLYAENSSESADAYNRVKIIDMLPKISDKMTLNDVARGSNAALTGVTIHSITLTDPLGVVSTVTLPDANIDVYYSTGATVANNKHELALTANSYGTWVWTDTTANPYSIPDNANAIKIDLTDGLANEAKCEVVFKATLPASAVDQIAWNSMGVGAHSVSPSVDIAPVEPAKSGVRRTFGDRLLSGRIWNDDGDGIRQNSESGAPGIIVGLYDSSETLLINTTTNAAGAYQFTGLSDGLYFIKFAPPVGKRLSPYGAGGDNTRDCDFVLLDSLAVAARNISGADFTGIDAGISDSLIEWTYVVTINAVDTISDTITICDNLLPYHYDDTIFYTADTKEIIYTAASGCDSVVVVTLIVIEKPVIGALDVPAFCEGSLSQPAAPSVDYKGGTAATPQWLISTTPGGSTFASVVFPYAATRASDNGKILAYVAANECGADTVFATLQVKARPDVGALDVPAFCEGSLSQPAAPSVDYNGGAAATPQWLISTTPGGPTFTSVVFPYAATRASDDGKILAYVAANECGTDTAKVTLTIYAAPTVGAISTPAAICANSALTLTAPTVTGNGATVTAQGWLLDDAPFNPSTALTFADNGKILKYYAKNLCDSVTTAGAPVTVYAPVDAGIIAKDTTVNYGTAPDALTEPTPASGGNGTYSYIWQSSADNSNWSNIGGATSATYAPPALTQTAWYRRIVISCNSDTSNTVKITVYNTVTAGVIADSDTICYNTAPAPLTGTAASGGNSMFTYQWQSSHDNINWTNIAGETGTGYTPPTLTQTTYYRRIDTSISLNDTTNTVTVTVLPAHILNYPDVRAEVCPVPAAGVVDLKQFIDTVELQTLTWTRLYGAPINADGEINRADLASYTNSAYAYTASNKCTSKTRKFYVHTIGDNFVRNVSDTVTVCYLKADALQISRLPGIDADGVWTWNTAVDAYVTQAANYGNAVTFDGKAAYLDALVPSSVYKGATVKKVEFTLTSSGTGCLSGESFKVVIILTPNIML